MAGLWLGTKRGGQVVQFKAGSQRDAQQKAKAMGMGFVKIESARHAHKNFLRRIAQKKRRGEFRNVYETIHESSLLEVLS